LQPPAIEERMLMSISTNPPVPAEEVTVDGVTYKVTEARTVLYIDRDLPWHSGRWPMESWFIVSNLDSDGQRIGLQLQFQIQTPPTGVDVVQLNVVVVNETAGISRNFEYLYPREQVELSADRMYISTSELTFSGDRNGCAVSVRGKDAQFDFTTTTAAPPVLMNGEGQFFFIDLDEQYEFAFPAMPTTGTVVIDTVTYQVTGTSWLDRQWGGVPGFFASGLSHGAQAPAAEGAAPPKVMNWIWTNPQLDNGVNVAAAQIRDMINNKIYLMLTAVHPDGTHVVVPRIEPVETSEYWTSPTTGHRYPTRCVFRAPQIDTELIVEVPYKQQEIVSSVDILTKFEGTATVTGTYQGQQVTGHAFLEFVGNWS
jgi:predicted secreted hydrolase